MSGKLKRWAKNSLLATGLDVRFKREPMDFVKQLGIRTVLDIGANQGQFAARVRKILPEAKIFSFEPLPGPFSVLQRTILADPRSEAFQLALGSEPGEADFERNDLSGASSMLKLMARSRSAFPGTANSFTVTVPVSTLDAWAAARCLELPLLVKMDVQGFEDRVIKGGLVTIASASVVISEVTFIPLYEKQALFDDIYSLMRSLGFRCGGMIDNSTDVQTGEILQADAFFVRGESVCSA